MAEGPIARIRAGKEAAPGNCHLGVELFPETKPASHSISNPAPFQGDHLKGRPAPDDFASIASNERLCNQWSRTILGRQCGAVVRARP